MDGTSEGGVSAAGGKAGKAEELPASGDLPGSWVAPAYYVAYMAYLFGRPEGEFQHWVTLVLLPLLVVVFLYRRHEHPIRDAWWSLGVRRGRLLAGMGVTLALGVVLGLVQVGLSRSGPAVLDAFSTGKALYLLPLAFVLMLFTAGFTEEFFFRGFLQARLEGLTHSRWTGLLLTSVLFGLYHLPYAYLNPNWPSHGDWGAAVGAALGQGVPAGLILGGLFIYSGRNLLSCVVLHALVDAFPAMALIRFG